ncbi:DNA polymerase-3 subunit gamma/tau [Anaerobranca californiensis DSM 14826]|jgi:DNA polymerase-3 subunit gamma/tau|uniref:DNA-directed DNA polymerase n=1 Tax=Anaerobranca californiensis DSM 14826 TaxID=1120989 RepID=A0A1M6R5L5_9FIRM|nr:DNA polymerase III subunit gamma/tau [Anaerobranca californiensis]SHK27779.1 DNA polymerase-3 subunit gamma/tau [Anaerobranca californiensis DSM 14826]
MAYKALYRKLRPGSFSQGYVAQQHIRTTLQNSLKNKKIAHAYLFSGPRGTGKTSTAKIFAKALNCLEGPTPEPCNVCSVCKKINENSSLDVLEIDAASNRGIDEIRDLRDKVNYAPSESRYKVYIIDEVHMLTTEAFNALLKTLEEPPTHVVFILATTEPHKLPATILSRCQRFDFRPFKTAEICQYLMEICENNGIYIEEEAAQILAGKADGSMRDALSLLDQLIVYGDGTITASLVLDVLGVLSPSTINELIGYIFDRKLDQALELLDIIIQQGKDIQSFIEDIINRLRDIMFENLKNPKGSIGLSLQELIRIIEIFIQGSKDIKNSSHPKILLETLIIKSIEGDYRKLSLLEKRIEDLEKVLNSPSFKSTPRVEVVEKVKDDKGQSSIGFNTIKNSWDKVLFAVKKESVSTHAWLKEGILDKLDGDTIEIMYEDKYLLHRENIMKENHKNIIEKVLTNIFNVDLKIKAITKEKGKKNNPKMKEKDNLVSMAEKLFGQDLVEVKD